MKKIIFAIACMVMFAGCSVSEKKTVDTNFIGCSQANCYFLKAKVIK